MNILSRVYVDNPVISSVLLTVFPVAELAVHCVCRSVGAPFPAKSLCVLDALSLTKMLP